MGYTKDIMIPDFTPEGYFRKSIKRIVGNGEWILWGSRWATAYEDLSEMRRIQEALEKSVMNTRYLLGVSLEGALVG